MSDNIIKGFETQILTEQLGPCGLGWKFEIVRLWTEPGSEEQVLAFAQIHLFLRNVDKSEWSDPIPGVGGSMLITKERNGLHASDEAYKMAKKNNGAPGIDGVTFKVIEEGSVENFLKQIRDELVSRTYRPQRVRKVGIPKDGGKKVRILSIPTVCP